MRVLIDEYAHRAGEADVDDDDIRDLYVAPTLPWWRINMVSTVDGSATGATGKSGSINNAADSRVFHGLRAMADAIVVGAGTAREEGYRPAAVPIVLVSRRGQLPERLVGAEPGKVLLATCASSPGLAAGRVTLGEDQVVVCGEDEVDLTFLRESLLARGFRHVLSEGGPHLFADLVAADALDEVCMSVVPHLVGGNHLRISTGASTDVVLRLTTLLEHDGTLLGRWAVPTRLASGLPS